MAHQWYISIDDREDGPYSLDDLEDMAQSRRLTPDDYVWHEGMPRWQPADEVLPDVFRRRRRRRSAPPVYDDAPVDDFVANDKPIAQFPGRLLSPGFLVFALIAGCFPWVDVHCNGITVISQSGLQSCYGGFTRHEQTINQMRQQRPDFARRLENADIDPAPLVIAVFGLFLLGAAGGLALRVGTLRASVLGGCAGVGLLLLVVQLAMGMPITKEVARANDEQLRKQMDAAQPQPNQPQFGQQFPPPNMAHRGNFVLNTSLSPFFWFTPLLAVLAVGGLAIEHFSIFAKKRRRRAYY